MNKRLVILSLVLLSLVSCQSDVLRVFHIDNGRKWFTVDEIKDMIDLLSQKHYNAIELALGNDGMRFLLDDMEIKGIEKTYTSEEVKAGVNEGNRNYFAAGVRNEYTEKEMDELIEYGNSKGIQIIPLINSPGHMDSIMHAGEKVTGQSLSYMGSARTIDVTNKIAVDFTQKFISKFIDYFSKKGIKYFNLGTDEYANDKFGSGFGELIKQNKFGYLIRYINQLADMVIKAGMTPITFNDPIYYDGVMEAECEGVKYSIDTRIVASYWTAGWSGYKIAKASLLASKGFKLLNTNGGWYYILGRTINEGALKNTKWNDVIGEGKMDVIGCMPCTWSDDPKIPYYAHEVENVHKQITILADSNPDVFKMEKELKFLA